MPQYIYGFDVGSYNRAIPEWVNELKAPNVAHESSLYTRLERRLFYWQEGEKDNLLTIAYSPRLNKTHFIVKGNIEEFHDELYAKDKLVRRQPIGYHLKFQALKFSGMEPEILRTPNSRVVHRKQKILNSNNEIAFNLDYYDLFFKTMRGALRWFHKYQTILRDFVNIQPLQFKDGSKLEFDEDGDLKSFRLVDVEINELKLESLEFSFKCIEKILFPILPFNEAEVKQLDEEYSKFMEETHQSMKEESIDRETDQHHDYMQNLQDELNDGEIDRMNKETDSSWEDV